jgi:L-cystine transport system substrate-binding protein
MKKVSFSVFAAIGTVIIAAGIFASCNKSKAAESKAATAAAADTSSEPVKVRKLIYGVNPGTSGNSFFDENGRLTGLEIELIRAIDEKLPQYEVDFEKVEYRSMFAALRANRVDLVGSNLRRNAEREDFPHAYRGYNNWANRLVVLDTDTSISGRLEDLAGKRVGTNQGTLSAIFMENYIKETGRKIELIYSTNSAADLIAGRLDTYITADNLVANLNRNYADQGIKFKTVGDPIDTNEGVETDRNVYYFFAHGNEQVRDDFSEVIYQLRKDGTVSKLLLQFFYEDRVHLIDEAEEEKYMQEIGKL